MVEATIWQRGMEKLAEEARQKAEEAKKQKKLKRIRAKEKAEYQKLKTRDIAFKKPPRP